MRYPTLTPDEVERLVTELLGSDSRSVDVTRAVKWQGTGSDFDLQDFSTFVRDLEVDFNAHQIEHGPSNKDEFEGRAAARLYEALVDVPIEILDDPGFWRYIAMVHLWWLIHWRERSTFDKDDYSKSRVYVDGKRPAECVPTRMFIRGRIAADAADPSLSWAVPAATDLWRSHIVRVRTSYTPELAAALIERQAGDKSRMTTDDLRAAARRLNRLNSNTVMIDYDRDACRAVIDAVSR